MGHVGHRRRRGPDGREAQTTDCDQRTAAASAGLMNLRVGVFMDTPCARTSSGLPQVRQTEPGLVTMMEGWPSSLEVTSPAASGGYRRPPWAGAARWRSCSSTWCVRPTSCIDSTPTVNDSLSEQYLACLRSVGARHDGQEVRSLGDGLVLAFPGALGDAVACAGDLHRSIRRLGREGDHGDLELRIGLSVGEATRLPDGSWSGAAVVEAARLVELARPGTTLTPDVTRRLLGPGSDVRTTPVGDRPLQGFPDPMACCEIVWDPDPDELAWEQRQLRRRVRRAAADWESRSRDPADLYRGARLAATLEVLDPAALVGAGARLPGGQPRAATGSRTSVAREVRRLRRLLVGVGVALVLALVAAGLAVAQRRQADRSASRATTAARAATVARLVAESQVQLTHDRYLSALLAVEADQRAHDAGTRSALLTTLLGGAPPGGHPGYRAGLRRLAAGGR